MADERAPREEREKVVVDRDGRDNSSGVVAAVVGVVILVVVILLLMGVFGGDDTDNDVTPVPTNGDVEVDFDAPETTDPEFETDGDTETEEETTE